MHWPFSNVINELTGSGWGSDAETKEQAIRMLAGNPEKLTAFTLLELLQRLNAIAAAIGPSKRHPGDTSISLRDDAATFANKSVGEFLYACELTEGCERYLIIAKDADHHCMVVPADRFELDRPPRPFIASEKWYAGSMKEAIEEAANTEADYHCVRLAFALDAVNAVEKGLNLEPYINGLPEEGDEE